VVRVTARPAVVRWAKMPDDVAPEEELRLARPRGTQAALESLPAVASEVGASADLLHRVQQEYEKHAFVVAAEDGSDDHLMQKKELVRRIRLGALEHKRRAITHVRNP